MSSPPPTKPPRGVKQGKETVSIDLSYNHATAV